MLNRSYPPFFLLVLSLTAKQVIERLMSARPPSDLFALLVGAVLPSVGVWIAHMPVSYTHLDVYKRQV